MSRIIILSRILIFEWKNRSLRVNCPHPVLAALMCIGSVEVQVVKLHAF